MKETKKLCNVNRCDMNIEQRIFDILFRMDFGIFIEIKLFAEKTNFVGKITEKNLAKV